ncbi:hotdog fold thioesterase [Ichthyenterobacterium sp. W332]|uniref:Hotdog fold thioesterase n=1 Tax=Microcosmobacter mediterraneus TaxID=3075607 RepID=A0ABU2YGG2_9FLAO|nr:hotdog fold thioesterase [Ichthyenterobacterium sp. W332]MDT0557269.1 hotdog fold thioesterase [Ichthyenterobacterium sp. W332]
MQLSKKDILKRANDASKNTLLETLDIQMVDFGDDYLIARMPVTPKVHQPDGVLHGGATAALAETCGSFAAHLFTDTSKNFVRGLEITANHLKAVKDGFVYAKATFIHKGRTTQLLDIRVTDEDDNLISVCRLSTITLPMKA